MFRQDFTCPALLEDQIWALPIRGYHPLWPAFPDSFSFLSHDHWPGPLSLVTTCGVSVDVLSSGYLDISVYRVCFSTLCIQIEMTLRPGFPIRISADQSLLAAPHSFSQRVTSFIASWHQGIHQMPLWRLINSHTDKYRSKTNIIHGKDALICSQEYTPAYVNHHKPD